jgi:hypothetical protein
MADVEDYASKNELNDILPLLRKGALVAQNPAGFQDMPELDEGEREKLADEVLHRWRLPKILYFTIIMNSIAAAIQGWDQTGSNAANLGFPSEFGISNDPEFGCAEEGNCDRNLWIVGFVNSAPYVAICLL